MLFVPKLDTFIAPLHHRITARLIPRIPAAIGNVTDKSPLCISFSPLAVIASGDETCRLPTTAHENQETLHRAWMAVPPASYQH